MRGFENRIKYTLLMEEINLSYGRLVAYFFRLLQLCQDESGFKMSVAQFITTLLHSFQIVSIVKKKKIFVSFQIIVFLLRLEI